MMAETSGLMILNNLSGKSRNKTQSRIPDFFANPFSPLA
jgi:hypothetical protein